MQKFLNGVNYWASHAGIDMWHEWNPTVIEDNFCKSSSKFPLHNSSYNELGVS